eukprot:5982326-Amphidinium_carterae.1
MVVGRIHPSSAATRVARLSSIHAPTAWARPWKAVSNEMPLSRRSQAISSKLGGYTRPGLAGPSSASRAFENRRQSIHSKT